MLLSNGKSRNHKHVDRLVSSSKTKSSFEVPRKRKGMCCLPDKSAGRDPSLPVLMECMYHETAVCIFCWRACSYCTAFQC